MKKLASVVGASVLSLGLAGSAFGALVEGGALLDFKSVPNTSDPEVVWVADGPIQLVAGEGAISSVPGYDALLIDTPVAITGATNIFPGAESTLVYDVTLSFSGLSPAGNAVTQPYFGGWTGIGQQLNAGTFSLTAEQIGGGTITLLEGNITDSAIFGIVGQETGWISGMVEYTGGAIFDAGPFVDNEATFSWSLLNINSAAGTGLQIEGDYIAPFTADMTGLFSAPAIPEPASVALFGFGALALMQRRRRA